MAKIAQWNINGLYSHIDFMRKLIDDHDIDILCIQETNLKENQILKLNKYSCYSKNRLDCLAASGGVSIIVKDNIYSQTIPINTNLEAVAVEIIIGSNRINLCNLYLSNRHDLNIEEIEKLILQLPTPYIIVGDFNSHNTLWGSHKIDCRGKTIENLINNNNLILLNDGSPTFFNSSNGKTSAIDLTLCNSNIANYIDWNALDDPYTSDHFPIIVSYNTLTATQQIVQPRWQYHKANWEKYSARISQKIDERNSRENLTSQNERININELINDFSEIILEAAEHSIPKTCSKTQKRNNPWWNAECNKATSDYKKALYLYKKVTTFENKIEFKRLKAIAKRTIKTAKQNSWHQFLQTINNQTPAKEVW